MAMPAIAPLIRMSLFTLTGRGLDLGFIGLVWLLNPGNIARHLRLVRESLFLGGFLSVARTEHGNRLPDSQTKPSTRLWDLGRTSKIQMLPIIGVSHQKLACRIRNNLVNKPELILCQRIPFIPFALSRER